MNYGTTGQWNITHQIEGTNYLSRQNRGWVSQISCWVKRASCKWIPTVCVHLCFILEKDKIKGTENSKWFSRGRKSFPLFTRQFQLSSFQAHGNCTSPPTLKYGCVTGFGQRNVKGSEMCRFWDNTLRAVCGVHFSGLSSHGNTCWDVATIGLGPWVTKRNIASCLLGLDINENESNTSYYPSCEFLVQRHGTFIS